MCVMEVRNGQRLSTEFQAMAHNTNTGRGDHDFLMAQISARGLMAEIEADGIGHDLKMARLGLEMAYHHFMAAWEKETARELRAGHSVPDSEIVGSERVHLSPADAAMVQEAHNMMMADAHRAEHYETRQGSVVNYDWPAPGAIGNGIATDRFGQDDNNP